jgi:NAD(P)-dependent dehydrogenase (short-subunit alcohol dehydrogenase family)
MELHLDNKTALVTGSTAGIGFAIAERLLQEGARVVINGRTSARVDEAKARLSKAVPKGRIEGVAADVGTEEGVKTLTAAFPDVDILVNNTGIFSLRAFEEIKSADWLSMFTTNVLSGAWLAQHHLPRMLQRNSGRIVFISSESALQIPVEMIHYGVSKAAQAALARGLAERTKGTAVTVNSVLAGPTMSEGVGTFVGEIANSRGVTKEAAEKDFFQTARPTSLLQRFETPAEIAAFVAFLASPVASAMNGAALRCEGGLLKTTY